MGYLLLVRVAPVCNGRRAMGNRRASTPRVRLRAASRPLDPSRIAPSSLARPTTPHPDGRLAWLEGAGTDEAPCPFPELCRAAPADGHVHDNRNVQPDVDVAGDGFHTGNSVPRSGQKSVLG